jgi:hypothetical protein
MPSLLHHQSNDFTKILLIGDSKSGKTGSLASLVKDYDLRILDFDNLLDILMYKVRETCPDRLGSVEYRSIRDEVRMGSQGQAIKGQPKAFLDGLRMLDRWKYDDTDLGPPAEWGSKSILVIDSLSRLCDAAYDYHDSMVKPGMDGRAIYANAQDAVEKMLGMLTAPSFRTNLIVISHGTYMDLPDGSKKIFPQGVGQKLSPKIPTYFPNYVRYRNINGRRSIQLSSDQTIDLGNTNPSLLADPLPIDTGLATIFAALRKEEAPKAKPQTLSLRKL